MKIAKSNHYLVNTDMELVLSLVSQLEELGITNFNQLKKKITQKRRRPLFILKHLKKVNHLRIIFL